jgi:Phospholipase_D-nuclease N-terminal
MNASPQALSTQIEIGSRTFWALLPVFVLVLAIMAYALLDLLRAQHVRYLPKAVWAVVIVLGSAPLGAPAYLVAGRTHHEALEDDHFIGGDDGDADSPREGGGPQRFGLTGRRLSRYERGLHL